MYNTELSRKALKGALELRQKGGINPKCTNMYN